MEFGMNCRSCLTILLCFICWLMCSLTALSGEPESLHLPPVEPVTLHPKGRLSFTPIRESSGLVKSRIWPDVFWTLNDSGNRARIFPVRRDGSIIVPDTAGRPHRRYDGISILGARNVDWEDIAADDRGNLIIADIGNNNRTRRDLVLYIVREPNPYKTAVTSVRSKIFFRYPNDKATPSRGNNFDAEALFWARGHLYLMTKHWGATVTRLYRFDSLRPSSVNPLTLVECFDIGGIVTAADATPDGKGLAVLTYNAVWLFEVDGASENYFSGAIRWLPIRAGQCEAICFAGANLLISNEGRDLFELPISTLRWVRK